jgi:hypothetical protein
VKLFGRKEKKKPIGDPTDDEGIVGLWTSKMAIAEGVFADDVAGHLRRLHEPGGIEREKRENDFMDLGMGRPYVDALDEIEFSVEDSATLAQMGVRKRGMAQVMTRWTVRGVHNRPLLGIPPSGQQVELRGVTYTTFRDYKIRVDYSYWEFPELTRRMVER